MTIQALGSEHVHAYMYGHTGVYVDESGSVGTSSATAGTVYCGNLTGIKAVVLVATHASQTITYTIYGSYDDDLVQATFESNANTSNDSGAGTEHDQLVVIGSGTLDPTGTDRVETTTTKPYAWITVSVDGSGAATTYNVYMRGN